MPGCRGRYRPARGFGIAQPHDRQRLVKGIFCRGGSGAIFASVLLDSLRLT